MTSSSQENGFPLISVVIAGKNERETIEGCITSVFDQSYPNFEAIYIDSNSTDGTFEIALRLQNASNNYRNCKRYLPVSVDGNSPASGRNYGVKLALGNIIAFVDADCVPERRWLENLIKYYSGDIMVVGGPNIHIRSTHSKMVNTAYDVLETFMGSGGSAQFLKIERLSYVRAIPTCNFAIGKSLFSEVGGFNEGLKFNEDSDLCYKLRKAGYKMLYSPEAKVYHVRGITSYGDFCKLFREYGYHRGKNVVRYPWLLAKFNAFSIICIAVFMSLFAISIQDKTAQTILIWLAVLLLSVIFVSSVKVAIKKHSLKLLFLAPVIYSTIYVVYNVGFLYGLIMELSTRLREEPVLVKTLLRRRLQKKT
jgi:glycosyltransferase involved in cell wall biosynthesis